MTGNAGFHRLKYRALDRIPDPVFYRLVAVQFRFQEPELRHLRKFFPGGPGGTAVDVGAWWGPWTYWLSRMAASVVAIEPQPRLAAFLEHVTPPHVRVLNAAASDRAGDLSLVVPGPERGVDALAHVGRDGDPQGGAMAEGETVVRVPAVRLDDLDLEDVRLVKIDVEGHEHKVLEGATQTIAAWKPTLVVEIEQRHLDRPIASLFADVEDLGYRGFFLTRHGWRPLGAFDVGRDQTQHLGDVKSRSYINNFVFTAASEGKTAAGGTRRATIHLG